MEQELKLKKRGVSGVVVFLLVILFLAAGLAGGWYVGHNDLLPIGKDQETTEKEEETDKKETKEESTATDLINNGKRLGKYSIYMGSNSSAEYTLTLFTTGDEKAGSFSMVEATSMSYNPVAHGGYVIKDSYIEFYNNMLTDSDKNAFVNAFSMQTSDLYQDSEAVNNGYTNQYRLKLNYENGKISNNSFTLEKLY